jgi:hypothetical protein
MKLYPKSFSVILFLIAVFSGCSQSPTSVGNKLIPGSNKYTIHDTTVAAVGDTAFKFAETNVSGSSLLVGNYSSVDAKALLLFLATFPDTMATVQIDTAELTLSANYGWNVPFPPPPAQFEIKEVLTAWSSTVTSDSVLNFAPTNSSFMTITSQDTLTVGETFTAQFDTSLVRKWINIYRDTLLPSFFSVALVTRPGMTNVGIWGFSQFGSSAPPNLEIIYEKNGVKDSISLNLGKGTFFATSSSLQLSGGIQTQGGIGVSSIVKFSLKPPIFDSVSSNKVIVNNATMLLTLKNSQSILGFGSADTVVAYLAESTTQLDSVGSTYYGYGYRKDTTQTTNSVYAFNITSMVQQWINTPSTNFGAALRAVSGNSTLDKHVFYSSKDSAYAPKLSITYSRK